MRFCGILLRMRTIKGDDIKGSVGKSVLSPLRQLDCKTGFMGGQAGGIYASWSGGRHRILGGADGGFCYHVMSRTCGGLKLFGAEEKEGFRKVMRLMSRFSGVQVLTYAILDNHFHILARVPSRTRFLKQFEDREADYEGAGEDRLLEHLLILYSEAYVRQVRREIAWMREQGMEGDVQKFLEKYKRRFCDLSLFVKEVKERFSRWFNKKHERRGTLWMDRFKSVLVEDGEALRTMSAYIDLNAVRAGMVEDPKDYRWCGYAEAVAGSKRARRGLCQVMEVPQDSWSDTAVNQSGQRGSGSWYRCWLMTDGEEVVVDEGDKYDQVKARVGIPKAKVAKALEKGGLLTSPELLCCKIRYFSEGIALGSKGFVDEWYEKSREHFSPKRKKGAQPIPKMLDQAIMKKEAQKKDSPLFTLKGMLKTKLES